MELRIFTIVAILGSMFLLPWWITLGLVLIGMIVFPIFYESIGLAFIFDLAYGIPTFVPSPFFSTLVIIALLFVVESLREMIIYYR